MKGQTLGKIIYGTIAVGLVGTMAYLIVQEFNTKEEKK